MPSIYIVDDDIDLLKVLKSLLSRKGFNVSTFIDWKTAKSALRLVKPQLILLDVFLAGIDGLEICQTLKASASTRHVPVLMFSAFPKIAGIAIDDYGADDFIAKPFEVTELIRKIHSVLAKNGERV